MPPRARLATLRRVAAFDLALTLPFALPVVVDQMLRALLTLDARLGLGTPVRPFDTLTLLFANLMGVLAVVWNWARFRSRGTDLAELDVRARCVVAAVILGYVVFTRTSPLLLVFVATEIAGAVIQRRALRGR